MPRRCSAGFASRIARAIAERSMVLNALVASSAATIFFARTSRRMSWMICSAPHQFRGDCVSMRGRGDEDELLSPATGCGRFSAT